MGTRKSTAAGLLALAVIAAGCATTPVYSSAKPKKLWRELALESRPRQTPPAPVTIVPPVAVHAVDASLDAARWAAAPGGSAPQGDEPVPAPADAGVAAPPVTAPQVAPVGESPVELPPSPKVTPVVEAMAAPAPIPPEPAVPPSSAGDALLLLALLGAAVAPLLLGRRA